MVVKTSTLLWRIFVQLSRICRLQARPDLIAEGDYVVGQWVGGGAHTGPAFFSLYWRVMDLRVSCLSPWRETKATFKTHGKP